MEVEHSHVEADAIAILKQLQRRDYAWLDQRLKEVRDFPLDDLSFGRLGLSIPEDHYDVLVIAYPLLQCTDAVIQTREWNKFARSDLAIPYKVNVNERFH